MYKVLIRSDCIEKDNSKEQSIIGQQNTQKLPFSLYTSNIVNRLHICPFKIIGGKIVYFYNRRGSHSSKYIPYYSLDQKSVVSSAIFYVNNSLKPCLFYITANHDRGYLIQF